MQLLERTRIWILLRRRDRIMTDIVGLTNKTDDELYALLGRPDDGQFDSLGTAALRGRQIFEKVWPRIKSKVCQVYNARPSGSDNLVDLAALILAALQGDQTVGNLPLFPLVAIIIKTQLEETCHE
jgi:hypothetical protein